MGEAAERSIALGGVGATHRLGAGLAALARAGDVILLSGPLGAGKTELARGFLRALGVGEEIPSPTFTLVQIYELESATVWHVDLYRLARPEETRELGLDEGYAVGITLIEWPDRLGEALPVDRLDVALVYGAAPEARIARISGHGTWAARLAALTVDD
ncbi:MAG: tRNA (adenosine(37)-N6)-threonylcarbamoyltransferase complex ATPase subunit type 1 TsaE [Alphaproteobacteria bacterium]